jgi:hypothetical protein
MCASFQVRCTSCYLWDKNESDQIDFGNNASDQSLCTKDGEYACTSEDVLNNRMVDVLTVMSASACIQLSIGELNRSQDLYSDVRCCSTDGCNYPPTPAYTPQPPPPPPPPPPSSPPTEPGDGPCEKPTLTWEVRRADPPPPPAPPATRCSRPGRPQEAVARDGVPSGSRGLGLAELVNCWANFVPLRTAGGGGAGRGVVVVGRPRSAV